MKRLLLLIFLLLTTKLLAQPNTEVYLVDITSVDGKTHLSNLRNISNNKGYDNQPSFYDNNTVLFSSTRNGQTDIAKYDITSGTTSWASDTPGGSEYSPLRIPESIAISAVRLDTTGLQRLYEYTTHDQSSKLILDGAKVGYHIWFASDMLVATILVENRMDLIVSYLANIGQYTVAQENVGRALHKIPNSELVSFISKEDGINSLKSIHPVTHEVKFIATLPNTAEDICWLPDGSLLVPDGNRIYKRRPNNKNIAPEAINLILFKEIHTISRMTVSPDGKQLAFVSENYPADIVQIQVDSFNAENLDAFAACYSENVLVRNFPSDTITLGNKALKAGYQSYFKNHVETTVEVVKRIQIGNVIIDQELVRRSGFTNQQAAIYEVNKDKITSMTFIHEKEKIPNTEAIINQNLTAYRARDIDAFLNAYTEDVEVYMFPNKLSYTGKEKMREGYVDFFKNTEGLTCEIKNRMVIGNIVIDEEYLSINGSNHSAVAIYEIEDGKISKVTFIQ